MTMLIAGHETTAAVLTWTLFALVQHPTSLQKALAEVDTVVGDARPGWSLFSALHQLQLRNWEGPGNQYGETTFFPV